MVGSRVGTGVGSLVGDSDVLLSAAIKTSSFGEFVGASVGLTVATEN